MRYPKSLSCVVAASVVGLSLTLPVAASASTATGDPDRPVSPSAAQAVKTAEIPDPGVEAQNSDRMKDNRTWRQIKVEWDWAMPDGMPATNDAFIPQTPMEPVPGYPQAGNALYGPLPTGANPGYQVVLDADGTNIKGRTKKLLCAWQIEAPTPVEVGASNCSRTQTVLLPEGTWPLSLTVTDRKSGVSKTVTSEITVLNVLFSISGDSYAAGEGFPPFQTTVNGKNYVAWDEPGCDRSRWSGFVRAAAMAEQADPRSNVTMVDVACSGADIVEQTANPLVSPTGGMLSPQQVIVQGGKGQPAPAQVQSSRYSGNPANPGFFPAQVDQLNAIAQGKTWDVTMFSIGGNDAGLGPIVTSCLFFDTLSVVGSQLLAGAGTQGEGLFRQSFEDAGMTVPPNYALYPGCYMNGQANLDFSSLTGGDLSKLTAGCVGSAYQFGGSQIQSFFALIEFTKGCQEFDEDPSNPTLYPGSALYNEVDDNLQALEDEYADLAPCLGASGGNAQCQTYKSATLTDKGQTVPGDQSPSNPLQTAGVQSVAQAMYPDLTQKSNGSGGTQFCSVQQDPTKPAGAEVAPGPNFGFSNLSDVIVPTTAQALQNPLMSPMNQVSNQWAFQHLYEGRAGQPITLPRGTDFPNNDPRLFDLSYPIMDSNNSDYYGPQAGWNAGAQNDGLTVTPKSDGLVSQLAYNGVVYGWNIGMSMYNKSHPYGLCAEDRWIGNLTDYAIGSTLNSGTGVGLHPNEAGYSAYADMLGPMAVDMAGLPVMKAADAVVPLGDGVATRTRVRLPDRKVRSGTRAIVKVRVRGALTAQAATVPGLRGRIEIRGNRKGTSHWMKRVMPIKANGRKTARLPRNWTRLSGNRSASNIRLRVRYLGNPTFQASNARQVRVRIVR